MLPMEAVLSNAALHMGDRAATTMKRPGSSWEMWSSFITNLGMHTSAVAILFDGEQMLAVEESCCAKREQENRQ